MDKDNDYLEALYYATKITNGDNHYETFEAWLKRQLIDKLELIDILQRQNSANWNKKEELEEVFEIVQKKHYEALKDCCSKIVESMDQGVIPITLLTSLSLLIKY